MDHGPVRPMTCLADASFLGVVVDDLRHGSELPSPSSRRPTLPACSIHALAGRQVGSTQHNGQFFSGITCLAR